MKLSVLIPTYRRPDNLLRCLEALKKQTRLADQIVVVVRDTDEETRAFIQTYEAGNLPIVLADVVEPGMMQAYNCGLKTVQGDVVAITDDDTEPHTDWLEKIEKHYERDPLIGGVGGRDIQPGKEQATQTKVGLMTWFGRTIGFHHVGTGPAREVDFIKGANCSYRTEPLKAIGFDTRLLGKGAQVHNEVALGLAFQRAGWKLIYDPSVTLMHYAAVRFDLDQRGTFKPEASFERAHNITFAVFEHLSPFAKLAFLVWCFLWGTKGDPGLLLGPLVVLKDRRPPREMPAILAGRLAGIRTALRTKRRETIPPSVPPAPPVASSQTSAASV